MRRERVNSATLRSPSDSGSSILSFFSSIPTRVDPAARVTCIPRLMSRHLPWQRRSIGGVLLLIIPITSSHNSCWYGESLGV